MLSRLLAPLALCAGLLAQTQVVPSDFAAVEAPSSTNFPFGLSSAARVQYLYGAQETGLAFPMFVQSLNLRANGTSTNLAKSGISLQISLSTTAGTHVSIGTACGGVGATSSGGALGGNLVTSMSGGGAYNPGVVLAGLMLWPSPIPIPGTTNCFLYQDVLASAAVTLSATGAAGLTLAVPPDASLRGVVLYSQWAAINAAFGLDMSQSRGSTIASSVVLRVHNTTSNTSGTGTVQNYVGIVIELG